MFVFGVFFWVSSWLGGESSLGGYCDFYWKRNNATLVQEYCAMQKKPEDGTSYLGRLYHLIQITDISSLFAVLYIFETSTPFLRLLRLSR